MTQAFTPGAPFWIDLGSTDLQGAHGFYSELFGWQVQELGPEAGGYGFYLKDGKMVAGFGPATDPSRGTSWSVYFGSSDIAATADLVVKHGGKVIAEPMQVMDQGKMAVFADPNGAFFSVFEPDKNNGLEATKVPGSLTWVELLTTDPAASKAFYSAVFGMDTQDLPLGAAGSYTLFEIGGIPVAGAMPNQANAWGIYIEVEDADAGADKAVSLGGKELLRDNSPAGRLAAIVDPQGGVFGIVKSPVTPS